MGRSRRRRTTEILDAGLGSGVRERQDAKCGRNARFGHRSGRNSASRIHLPTHIPLAPHPCFRTIPLDRVIIEGLSRSTTDGFFEIRSATTGNDRPDRRRARDAHPADVLACFREHTGDHRGYGLRDDSAEHDGCGERSPDHHVHLRVRAAHAGAGFTELVPAEHRVRVPVHVRDGPLRCAGNRLAEAHNPGIASQAGLLTFTAFGALTMYSFLSRRDFSAWGSFLFVGLIVLILTSVLNMFFGSAAGYTD